MSRLRALLLSALLLGVLSAARPVSAEPSVYDPWETYNRAVFAFNNGFGNGLLEPLRQAYVGNVSTETRAGVANVFSNLREPWTAVSSVLRADLPNARAAAGRFLINSTAGIGGWYDVATERYELASRYDDLGNVLCSWGLKSGPYMVLPFFGPMTARDLVGRAATMAGTYSVLGMDGYILYRTTDGTVRYLEDGFIGPYARDPAKDAYAIERALYATVRDRQCAGGMVPPTSPYGLDQQ